MKRSAQLSFEKAWRDPRGLMQVVVGPRQVGKTTTLTDLIEKEADCIFASADTPSTPTPDFIIDHWNKARELAAESRTLVLDEIQKIPRWSEVVKALWDEDKRKRRKIRVGLLGSAALLIEKGLSESLTGRFELHRFQHWSFGECRRFFKASLADYLRLGGYPKAYDFLDNDKRAQDYLQNSIVEPTLGRDILALHAVDKPALLRQFFGYVTKLPAQTVSFQKILGATQGSGNVATLIHYSELFEKAFLIKGLSKYALRAHRSKRSIPKWIVLNPALVDAKVKLDKSSRGFVAENAVGAHLLNLSAADSSIELNYWREDSKEIDFILMEDGKPMAAIEVKSGAAKETDRKVFEKCCDDLEIAGKRLFIGGPQLESLLSTSSIDEVLNFDA